MTKFITSLPILNLAALNPIQLRLVRQELEKFFYNTGTNIAFHKASKNERSQIFKRRVKEAIKKQILHIAHLNRITEITNRKKVIDENIVADISLWWLPFHQAFEGHNIAILAFLVWAGEQGGQAGLDKMVPQHTFQLTSLIIKNQLRDRLDFLNKVVDQTTKEWIARTIAEGTKQNLSDVEIVQFLRREAGRVAGERAELIYETELMNGMNLVEFKTYQKNGIEKVIWKTSNDERVCMEICLANEAAGSIFLGEEFPMGQTNPPAHGRCRCYLLPVLPTEIKGQVWTGN